MTEYAIEAVNIRKQYADVKVIRGVTLRVPKSQIAAIVGKSGSGKSTLLGIMSGLETPDEGRVLVQESDIFTLDDDGIAAMRQHSIGIVFQNFNLIPALSAIENVLLSTVFDTGVSAQSHRQRATALLNEVGIGHRIHHRPAALSGGEQQRVAIARALINEPAIVLADEPTGNLDESTAKGVFDLLLGLSRNMGTTLLMVTHDTDIASAADMQITLKDGSIDYEKS